MSVKVTGPASTPICLSTQHLILKDMTATMGEHNTAAACFRFSHSLEVNKREPLPGVVLSKTTSSRIFADPQLFSDPRCAPCNPQPTGQSGALLSLFPGNIVLRYDIFVILFLHVIFFIIIYIFFIPYFKS